MILREKRPAFHQRPCVWREVFADEIGPHPIPYDEQDVFAYGLGQRLRSNGGCENEQRKELSQHAASSENSGDDPRDCATNRVCPMGRNFPPRIGLD